MFVLFCFDLSPGLALPPLGLQLLIGLLARPASCPRRRTLRVVDGCGFVSSNRLDCLDKNKRKLFTPETCTPKNAGFGSIWIIMNNYCLSIPFLFKTSVFVSLGFPAEEKESLPGTGFGEEAPHGRSRS